MSSSRREALNLLTLSIKDSRMSTDEGRKIEWHLFSHLLKKNSSRGRRGRGSCFTITNVTRALPPVTRKPMCQEEKKVVTVVQTTSKLPLCKEASSAASQNREIISRYNFNLWLSESYQPACFISLSAKLSWGVRRASLRRQKCVTWASTFWVRCFRSNLIEEGELKWEREREEGTEKDFSFRSISLVISSPTEVES